jgi:CRISPR-associated endonuclease/helicase Cas3
MHVLFISNCELGSNAKTKSILDRYATRVGRQAWTSPFTEDALDEVRKALSKTATRQTSVACYRNKSTSELMLQWIVGNSNCYDERGFFAPETQQRKQGIPVYLIHSNYLAQLTGLLHDFGKATQRFHEKLLISEKDSKNKLVLEAIKKTQKDRVRHEWISAWIAEKMEGDYSVDSFKKAWVSWKNDGLDEVFDEDKPWLPINQPIDDLSSAMMFCVSTHHKLLGFGGWSSARNSTPPPTNRRLKHTSDDVDSQKNISDVSIINWDAWSSVLKNSQIYNDKLEEVADMPPDYWRGLAIVTRACLVLADHEISSQVVLSKSDNGGGWANTIAINGKRNLNQTLPWHLENVAKQASRNTQMFAGNDLPFMSQESLVKISARVGDQPALAPYAWQNRVVDFIAENKAQKNTPHLVFNVAGTGSGKTIANIKILSSLRPQGLRITAGFNLRTLTLQTRDAFKNKLGITDADLACVVGGPITESIHDFSLCDDEEGALNMVFNIEEKFDKKMMPQWLQQLHSKNKVAHQKLLAPPVLVTTMDHLVDAGNPGKQASHALAMIRIAHSDLIIDEADSYDPKGLMAVLRVIEISAMFGRNVVISSATLPSVLANAITLAWNSGRRMGIAIGNGAGDRKMYFSNLIEPDFTDETNPEICSEKYKLFTGNMAKEISVNNLSRTKKFRVVHFTNSLEKTETSKVSVDDFLKRIIDSAVILHESNFMMASDGRSEKKVSIGMVRMANVTPLTNIAERLIAHKNPDFEIRVMTYHAREVTGRRAWKEKNLDQVLKRDGNPKWWENSEEISKIVQESSKDNIIFIVVASPVEEVGRDHDFDWAVIEPSSIISIIQTAGRVNRHRLRQISDPNIHVLSMNWKAAQDLEKKKKYFCRPGFQVEIKGGLLTHLDTSGDLLNSFDLLGNDNLKMEKEISNQCITSQILDLDTRLIFGSDQEVCRFAVEDSKGIELCIEGALKAIEDKRSWMNSWVYECYPLRDQSSRKETFICKYELDVWNVFKTVDFKQFGSNKKAENSIDPTHLLVKLESDFPAKDSMFFSPSMSKVYTAMIEPMVSKNKDKKDLIIRSMGEFSVELKEKDGLLYEYIIDEFGVSKK